jgi:hypothetical protein
MTSTDLIDKPLFHISKHTKTGSIDFLSARNDSLINPLMNHENDYQIPLNLISDPSISLVHGPKSS